MARLCGLVQSSWLQVQRSGFDFDSGSTRFSEKGCLERCPLSLVSTIEELLGRKRRGSNLVIREYGREDPSSYSLPTEVGINFADKLRSLVRYISLAESGHRTFPCSGSIRFRCTDMNNSRNEARINLTHIQYVFC
jgi:hypothetical protein